MLLIIARVESANITRETLIFDFLNLTLTGITMNRPLDPENPNLRNRTQLRGPAVAPRRVVDMPNLRRAEAPRGSGEGGRRLVVGRDITLSGQISKCDFLVVEGAVEGMRYDGQSIEITETGSFSGGNIEVGTAEISGSFDGNITVRGRLTIRPTGRVSGHIKYSEIEVNAGGQVNGEMGVLEAQTRPATASGSGVTPQEPPPGDFTSSEDRLAGE